MTNLHDELLQEKETNLELKKENATLKDKIEKLEKQIAAFKSVKEDYMPLMTEMKQPSDD